MIKVSANKESNSSEGHLEKEAPILLKNASGEVEGIEGGSIERDQPTFNLQKKLEKGKIHVPLTKLLK